MIACFLSNISAKYYKNPPMLCRVIAKNVSCWHSTTAYFFWATLYLFSVYAKLVLPLTIIRLNLPFILWMFCMGQCARNIGYQQDPFGYFCCFISFGPMERWYLSQLHCVSKKFPPLNFLQLCQIITDFPKFLPCWKVYEICYKTHVTLPTSP